MRLRQTPALWVLACCLGLAGCAVDPPATPRRLVDMPIASAYADATFTLNTFTWRDIRCAGQADGCAADAAGERFAAQVARVADRLQEGSRKLYPDLAQRIPNVADGRFDVYVIPADDPGSASTADGRIALHAGLARDNPDDAWLAFVVAREMGHVLARHPEENSALGLLAALILNVAIPGSGLLKSVVTTTGSALAARSKRTIQGREADSIALNLLKASGYPLRDVARSLQKTPLAGDSSWGRRFAKSSTKLLAEAATGKARTARARSAGPAIGVAAGKPLRIRLPAGDGHVPIAAKGAAAALTGGGEDHPLAAAGSPP